VTGAGGQLGTALGPHLPEARFATHAVLDITDPFAVDAAVAAHDVVVHCAAMTQVDRCEAHPNEARRVNHRGTANVVRAADRHGARVLYVSTDYVFDGTTPEYEEHDRPNPINVYGRSKLGGEETMRPERDLIIRTSWVFGRGRNFVNTIIHAAQEGSVRVVEDQIGRPTSATDLALAVRHLIDQHMTGIVHVAGDGPPASWADVAELAIRHAGLRADVVRIDSHTFRLERGKAIAPRPANSTLSLDTARRLDVPLVEWRAGLQTYVEDLV
jgi:dTDP-4-dehydrorhamnose reductase